MSEQFGSDLLPQGAAIRCSRAGPATTATALDPSATWASTRWRRGVAGRLARWRWRRPSDLRVLPVLLPTGRSAAGVPRTPRRSSCRRRRSRRAPDRTAPRSHRASLREQGIGTAVRRSPQRDPAHRSDHTSAASTSSRSVASLTLTTNSSVMACAAPRRSSPLSARLCRRDGRPRRAGPPPTPTRRGAPGARTGRARSGSAGMSAIDSTHRLASSMSSSTTAHSAMIVIDRGRRVPPARVVTVGGLERVDLEAHRVGVATTERDEYPAEGQPGCEIVRWSEQSGGSSRSTSAASSSRPIRLRVVAKVMIRAGSLPTKSSGNWSNQTARSRVEPDRYRSHTGPKTNSKASCRSPAASR